MRLEVAYNAFVGNDAVFLESVHPLSNLDVDIATRVSDGQEEVINDHLVWDFFEVDLHVMEVGHWVVEVVVYYLCRQVAVPFAGI